MTMMKRYHYEQCPQCAKRGNDTRADNLVKYTDGSAHCFACGYHLFAKCSSFYNRTAGVEENVPKALLPADFSREVPATALKWLLQWGLPYSYWRESIGYSEAEERLVFRVGNPMAFSIGRYVGGQRDQNQPRKWYVWGDCHKHVEPIGEGSTILLVEDIISAHKVGQLTTCIPLFGTNIFNAAIYYLLAENKPVKIWLDKDQEGLVKKKASRLSSIIQQSVDIIVTEKDPKCYDLCKIQQIIK